MQQVRVLRAIESTVIVARGSQGRKQRSAGKGRTRSSRGSLRFSSCGANRSDYKILLSKSARGDPRDDVWRQADLY